MTNEERNIADVQFIFDEVQRFRLMSPKEVRSYLEENPNNFFAHLSHPTLGILFCGAAAHDRFKELANRTIKQGSLEAKSFHQPDYVHALRDAFLEFFVDGRRAVNQSSVTKLVNRARAIALDSLVQLTYHLPCNLFTEKEPNKFTLGPVRFTRVEDFVNEYENALNDYRQSRLERYANHSQMVGTERSQDEVRAEGMNVVDRHMRNIREFYSRFGWVASVSVPSCHKALSQNRAERTVDAALDALRLLLPSYIQYRRANAPDTPSRIWELTTDATGKIVATVRLESKSASAGDGWHTWALNEASEFWKHFGTAIEWLLTADKPDELNQRLLDALNWFGQAVLEQNPAAKVVKYTAALE